LRKRLRHIAQINPSSPRFDRLLDDAEVPFLPMEKVWPGGLDLSERRPKSAVATGYTRFESGDVIVPKITPTFEASRTVLVPEVADRSVVGTTELHVIRPGPEVDPRYLAYIFHSHDFLRLGEAEMYGVAGQKRVPDAFIRDWSVDLPPLDEQHRIADFLDAETAIVDGLIQQRSRQREVLDELKQATTDDAVTRLTDCPRIRLGYLARVQTGVTVDGSRQQIEGGVTHPYLRVGNVQAGYLDLNEVVEMTVPRTTAAASRLRGGDVLMTEGGDLDKLGRGTVWRGEIEECLHQNHVFAVRPDGDELVSDYLALLTGASFARRYFESTGNKTTNLASTSSSKIRGFRIPVPETSVQRSTVKEVEARLTSVACIEDLIARQLALLAERRQTLITAAVTGQIDVTTARGVST